MPDSFSPHPYYAGYLSIEDGFSEGTIKLLKSLGHKVVKSAVCGMGATVTRRNNDTGVLSAGSDPRRECYAIGW